MYNGLMPLVRLGVEVAMRGDSKLAHREQAATESLESAYRKVDTLRKDGRTVLLTHAASAGEFEQLKPLLRRMDRERYILVQSFFSPTIYDRECDSPLFDVACYHPLDFRSRAQDFFQRLRPAHYLVTRHDLWPNHLAIAQGMGIRTILINANLHPKSMRLHPWARPANRAWLSTIDHVHTGTETSAHRWAELVDRNRIHVTGDTRFDQVWERAQAAEPVAAFPKTFTSDRRAIVFGSLLQSDEPVVMEALGRCFPAGEADLGRSGHRIIVVPHEVDERTLRRNEERLLSRGLRCSRLSDVGSAGAPPVILVDKVGILPEIYAHGTIAYIGGGFGAGVHSVIEPAAHGCVTTFGPNIDILEEAVEICSQGLATPITDAGELHDLLRRHLDAPEAASAAGAALLRYVESRTGASTRIIDRLFAEN